MHKDEVGKLETIESYAQTQPSGVQAFEMDYALKNENPRIVLLRPKDSKIGARAADIMSREAKAGKADPTKQIAYDYTMSFADDKHMTCSAVSYWGYYKASDGKFIIPEMRSTPNPKLTQLYSKTGINPEPMLTAADMELDSRFDLLLEFRDHRLISDSRLREAVAQSLFKWMSDLDYTIRPGFKSFVIDDIIFPLHKTKLWPMIKGLTGLSIPPDAPEGFIETLDALNSISDVLYKRVFDENSKYFKQSGWNMTHNQMMAVLETYRQADYQKCRSSGVTQFHQAFTSRTCLPKTNR